jgi:hypothetical protein
MIRRTLLAVLFLIAASGCGSNGPPQSEDYGNLLNSPQGLLLVQEEHQTGWGRPDCFACHEIRNIHIINRTGDPSFDLAQVRAVVDNLGLASCPQCHGTNGVQQ